MNDQEKKEIVQPIEESISSEKILPTIPKEDLNKRWIDTFSDCV